MCTPTPTVLPNGQSRKLGVLHLSDKQTDPRQTEMEGGPGVVAPCLFFTGTRQSYRQHANCYASRQEDLKKHGVRQYGHRHGDLVMQICGLPGSKR